MSTGPNFSLGDPLGLYQDDSTDPGELASLQQSQNLENILTEEGGTPQLGGINGESLGVPTIASPNSTGLIGLLTSLAQDGAAAFASTQQPSTVIVPNIGVSSIGQTIAQELGLSGATGATGSSSTTGWVLLVVAIFVIMFFVLLFRHSGK